MKRFLISSLILALLLIIPGQAQATQSVHATFLTWADFYYDQFGVTHKMDVKPIRNNGRVYVPIKYLANALGIADQNITWDAGTQTVLIYKDGISLKITINSNIIYRNNQPSVMDAAPIIVDNRTYLPARFVAESFGQAVQWDQANQAVVISWDDSAPNTSPQVVPQYNNSGGDSADIPMPEGYEDKTPSPLYKWAFKNKAYEWDSLFKVGEVNLFLNNYSLDPHPHRTETDFLNTYCINLDPLEDQLLGAIARVFETNGNERGFSRYDTVCNIITFVQQNIKYVTDIESTGIAEYPRYPLETLLARQGDCEDTAILTAKLIRGLGYGTALVFYENHCAVGVKCDSSMPGWSFEINGDKYFYLETTSTGWQIGDMPEDLQFKKALVLPLP